MPHEVVDTLFEGAVKEKHSPVCERECSSVSGAKSEHSWWPEEKKQAATEAPSVVPELENTPSGLISTPSGTPGVLMSTPGETPGLTIVVGKPQTPIIKSLDALQEMLDELEEVKRETSI